MIYRHILGPTFEDGRRIDASFTGKSSTYRFDKPLVCKTLTGAPEMIGGRRFRGRASKGSLDDMGEIVDLLGLSIKEYLKNPLLLADHDAAKIIGRAVDVWKSIEEDSLFGIFEFAKPGSSQVSDERFNAVQEGLCRGLSIGFDPIVTTPMDPARPRGPAVL